MGLQKFILLSGSLLGALSVMIGAFGAHAWKEALEAQQRMETFDTAVKYQFYHTLGLLIVGLLMDKIPHRWMGYSGLCLLAGIFIFSGSLYLLCLTENTKWGAVTPMGGLLLIIGWCFLFAAVIKNM